MTTVTLTINGEERTVECDLQTPLLWILREHLNLTGTKYGCGKGICGSCTIHVDNHPVRACTTPVKMVEGKKVTTIEGLSNDKSHPLQRAWIEAQVPQCGYCQSGQIMQAAAILNSNPNPSREEIISRMNGILCRCGTYYRIVKAIENVAKEA